MITKTLHLCAGTKRLVLHDKPYLISSDQVPKRDGMYEVSWEPNEQTCMVRCFHSHQERIGPGGKWVCIQCGNECKDDESPREPRTRDTPVEDVLTDNPRTWKAGTRIVYLNFPATLLAPVWETWSWVLFDHDKANGRPPISESALKFHLLK